MEDPETAPGWKHTFGDDPANAGDLLTQTGLGKRGHGGSVYIAMGEMPEKVSGSADAQPFQRFGAPLSDSFEELDRRV